MNPNNWSGGGMGGGAGRGMPNMNMGMGMGMGMNMNMNQNMQQPKGPNFLAIIYQNLSASQGQDGPFTGWRNHVSIQERAGQVKILFDSLRMLGQAVDIRRSLDIAVAFERRQFLQSASLEAYKQSLHEKLSSIRDQRQHQAQVSANNMPNNMQMMNPTFQQAQQQPQMNQMTPNMNFQQPNNMQPSPSFNPMIQQRPMNQPNQNVNPSQMNQANRPNAPELTKEDNTWINTRAAEMAKSTARDDMTRIVESMEPRVRQSLQEKKIDPIIYHFRMKATKEFRVMQAQKNAQNQLNNMRMSTPQQNPGIPANQPNGTPFMNIDQFRSQQDEGMRSQQEGQLVVPASQPSVNDIRQRFAQQIRAQNPNASPPELQQMLMNRLRQWQAQMQARGQMNVAQANGIPNAGQGQNLTGGMPQPRPVSVLNQPMNQQGPVASPLQNLSRPQSRPQPGQPGQQGQPGQAMGQAQPAPGQFTPEQIMGHWEKLPLPLKNMLNNAPQDLWPKIVVDYRKTHQQAQAQQAQQRMMLQQQQQQQQQQPQPHQQQPQAQPQQGPNMQRTASQQPPNVPANQRITQMQQNNQFASPVAMQQSLSRGAEQANTMPNMTPIQRPQQQQPNNAQNALRLQQQQQMAAAQQQSMNQPPQNQAVEDAMIRESDDQPLPVNMRQQLTQVFPGHNVAGLSTWRQLRELALSINDPRVAPAKIRAMQLQFVRRMQQQRAAQQAMIGNGSQPVQQQPQVGGQGMAQQNSQNARSQITQQDILLARRQNPNWGPLSDDQIRQLLLQQQPKSGNQNKPAAPAQAPIPNSQVQNNAKASTQQNTAQQGPQQNRQPPQQQNQPTKPAGFPETKSLKRPNQDDAPEQNNAPQGQKLPNQITKEQFEKMTPAEQEKLKLERKKFESVRKVAQLSQEVNSSMKKLPPITNMDAQSRQRITNMLTSDTLKSILQRFDTFLVAFAQTETDIQMLQTLIQHRWRLMQQFKPESVKNKTFVPADHFTLNIENLETIINQISNKFHQALQKTQRQGNNNNNAGGNNSNAQQQSIPLTTENLNMAAQQAAQQQKRSQSTKPKDGPPPAPTVDKPPFQFPGDRGQGTPKYATPGLKPEDLKLPPKKKQRNDQSASPATPVQTTIPKPVFRCTFPGCALQPQGFASQAELEMHKTTIHKPDMEPVKDPLNFLDSSLQQAFNLDETFQSKKPPTSAPSMQKTLSRPGSGTPKGNRIGTPSGMGRTASQQGSKDSPSSTAQQKSIGANKKVVPNAVAQAPIDEWQDATFSFDNLNDIFGPNETGDVIPMGNDSLNNMQAVANTYMKNNEEWKWNERDGHDSSNSSAKSKSPEQGSETSLPNGEKAAPNPYHVDLNVGGTALPVLEGNFEDLFMDDGTGGERDWTMLDTDGSLSPWEKIEGMDGSNQNQMQQGPDFELDSWITMPAGLDDGDFPTGDEAMKILEGMPMNF